MANEPWTFENPLCSQIGLETFFEDSEKINNKGTAREDYKAAIKVCSSCAHISECAEWAIKHELFGIWGGTTPMQRKTIRRQRNIIIDGELKTLR